MSQFSKLAATLQRLSPIFMEAMNLKCYNLENKPIRSPVCNWIIVFEGRNSRWTYFVNHPNSRYNGYKI